MLIIKHYSTYSGLIPAISARFGEGYSNKHYSVYLGEIERAGVSNMVKFWLFRVRFGRDFANRVSNKANSAYSGFDSGNLGEI